MKILKLSGFGICSRALLIVIVCLLKVFPCQGSEFKFVVWGDSQFHNEDIFERIVLETELLKPAFVLQAGDLIHGYTYDPENARRQWVRFKKQIAPLTCPYYPAPGNHDVTTPEIEPIYGEIWGKNMYYYSFDYKGSHFIILDTYLNNKYDTIPEEEMEWLKRDLEKNKGAEHIFIMFHSPLHLDNKYDWESVHELLRKYPVRGIFTGHSHIYDYRVREGINYFCLNTSGEMTMFSHLLGRSHHYLVVSVQGANVSFAVIAEGRIYPPDAVAPGTSGLASRYLMEEQTILIPDPSTAALAMEISVPLSNKADESRTFELNWEGKDYRWMFEPCGMKASLDAGETRNISFKVTVPQGAVNRRDLPGLRVDSPYTNKMGYSTTLTYYYRLFFPPETVAQKVKGKIAVDGVLDESAWCDVAAITRLVTDYEGTPAKEQTIVKVVYDEEHLYVGIIGEEPSPEGLAAYAHGEVPLVFGDDDFELFFDTDRDLITFYRLMTNSKGTILCSGPEGLFSFDFRVETHVGEDYWSAEFMIPFAEIGAVKPGAGDIWGFNVRRHRHQAERAQSDWSKMINFPYQPQYFGLLRFE